MTRSHRRTTLAPPEAHPYAMPSEKAPPPVAGCPSCRAPMVGTIVFPGVEFYCLECGAAVDFLSPVRLDPTPETLARLAEIQAEWKEHAGDFIVPRGFRRDCERCQGSPRESHDLHATDEERAADERARAWLRERAGK